MAKIQLKTVALAAVLVVGYAYSAAQAATLDFYRVTSNNAENVASQFSVEVLGGYDSGTDTYGGLTDTSVTFQITNNVGIASSISEVYFDDGTLLALASVRNSVGGTTDFNDNGTAKPGNLPGGNNVAPAFVATQGFSADAQGNPSKGVDAAIDILEMEFTLQESSTAGVYLTVADVLDSLENGDLRIGFHVRAIGAAGGSDSFINIPYLTPPGEFNPPIIPVPASLPLLLSGLALLAWMRKRTA